MEWKKLRQTIQKAKAENRSPNGQYFFLTHKVILNIFLIPNIILVYSKASAALK